ncbi:hypothetical protein V8E55_005382 [Tylopilus felleus]
MKGSGLCTPQKTAVDEEFKLVGDLAISDDIIELPSELWLVGIGYPPTYYNLTSDTGSSNTFLWVDFDQVTLGPSLVIPSQSIGGALSFTGFEGVDGIIGLGSSTSHRNLQQ